ncbi:MULTISPECIES: DinB family protein [Capnocytophaga]|uniref:Damage-inducible protein DinB n=1 Tax=Capnocytophaga canimorsus TaxID=28188 RepID=A0AAC9Z208_9FLAO|nr:DinB family protein [Capnocytophaga canimorsus]ATA93018.1 damage-inducible protein DinB [Capnocytophaga canimorsus]GJQ05026.1 DNA damage-inducible protein DinB [Capnocytophaga canimorsus]
MVELVTKQEWLDNWQINRRLTRKVIEAFPEKELFEFSVGGMRPFSKIVDELIYLGVIALRQFSENEIITFENHDNYAGKTKAEILSNWDKLTEQINTFFANTSLERFREEFNVFGMFNYPIIHNLDYLLQNEIHHRGQGYVYLRALGIEPPAFYSEF